MKRDNKHFNILYVFIELNAYALQQKNVYFLKVMNTIYKFKPKPNYEIE